MLKFGQRVRQFLGGTIESKSAPPPGASTLAEPSAWLLNLFGDMPVTAGVAVGPAEAMRCTAAACAVRAISEAIGQLPVRVYYRAGDQSAERDTLHPVEGLLNDAANDLTPASEFRQQLTQDALLHDVGGLAFINRVEGRPIELNRLDPGAVTLAADTATGAPVYRVNGQAIPAADILHLRNPLTGCVPVCARSQAREAIGLAIVLEQHAARLFGNGAKPSGVLSLEGNPSGDALAKAKEAWQLAHRGSNGGGTAVMPTSAKWEQITLNSVDAQFLELRAFSIAEIARAFRVPPVLLMDYGRATWGNSEEMGRQFVTYTLLPWIKRWEGEIKLKLFSADQRDTYFAEFLTDDLLKGDLDKRAEAYSKLVAARVLNQNEVRALENRPPYSGGEQYANPNTTGGAAHA